MPIAAHYYGEGAGFLSARGPDAHPRARGPQLRFEEVMILTKKELVDQRLASRPPRPQ